MDDVEKVSCQAVEWVVKSFALYYLFWGIWLLVRIFCFDTFVIPSESMTPTLRPGDKIVVNKMILGARIYRDFHFDKKGVELKSFRLRGLRGVRHNDMLVFNMPCGEGGMKFVINYVYCKCCVGLPGDSVSIVNGIYRNNNYPGPLGYVRSQKALGCVPDSLVSPSILHAMPYDDHLEGWTIKNFGPMYVPRRDDVVAITPTEAVLYKKILEWELKAKVRVDWERRKVYTGDRPLVRHRFEHDYCFMAGDNVMDSKDSRYFGLVPFEYIVGVVSDVVFSKAHGVRSVSPCWEE